MRPHKVARWLLAPFVFLGVATLGIFAGIYFGWYTDIRPSHAEYAVKLEDWKNHPEVKEVRAIYDQIQSGMRGKKYKTKTRSYDIDSPSCPTYPIKSETLVVDEGDRPRLLKIDQIISHRELLSVERYYDTAGRLRFVFVDHASGPTRIYLNAEGKVFWAVEQGGDKFTVGDYSTGDWETEPNNAKAAKGAFNEAGSCPEITK